MQCPMLLDEHGPMILSLGRKLCGNGDEAEDVVQETFLQAYKGWSGFEGRSNPRTWLTLLRRVFANAFIASGLANRPILSHSKSCRHLETTQWVSLTKIPTRR